MAYQEYTITSLADVIPIVSSFGATLGYDVVADVFRHPNYEGAGPGGPGFKLSSTLSGLNEELIWTCTTGEFVGNARIRSPILGSATGGAAVRQTPTKLFLIGMLDPEPYIAIVVQYGYNLYRHLYLGNLEKQGTFEGGSIIAAQNGGADPKSSSGNYWWGNLSFCQWMFSSTHLNTAFPRPNAGGVYVVASDNAVSWRHFKSATTTNNASNLVDSFDGAEALGGMGDNVNDQYVPRGKAALAGANVLVPINIVLSRKLASEVRFKPVGIATGVRMLNIQELESEDTVDIAGDTWYSFPAISKRSDNNMPTGTLAGQRYYQFESSYYFGYAYRG